MIPPLVRIGPPPAEQLKPILGLFTDRGWVLLERTYGKGRGDWSYRVHTHEPDQRQMVFTTAIICWMPQDGS